MMRQAKVLTISSSESTPRVIILSFNVWTEGKSSTNMSILESMPQLRYDVARLMAAATVGAGDSKQTGDIVYEFSDWTGGRENCSRGKRARAAGDLRRVRSGELEPPGDAHRSLGVPQLRAGVYAIFSWPRRKSVNAGKRSRRQRASSGHNIS